jgi:uncharacterized protein (DUF924 family)
MAMDGSADWPAVYQYWFPPGIEADDAAAHQARFVWWFRGGANAGLAAFAATVEAALAGQLDHWAMTPRGRLALILALDQFPRGLFAGTARAYAGDPAALALAEAGLANGHYDALRKPWEEVFFLIPLVHAEGERHAERLDRVVAAAEAAVERVPERLRPVYAFSAGQARAQRDVILRFGRFPHRNAILGRASTPEEAVYVARGEFPHTREPPAL